MSFLVEILAEDITAKILIVAAVVVLAIEATLAPAVIYVVIV